MEPRTLLRRGIPAEGDEAGQVSCCCKTVLRGKSGILEAQVLGFEAYKSSIVPCPRLEDSTIFWFVKKENNQRKLNLQFQAR